MEQLGGSLAVAVFLAVFVKSALDRVASLIRNQWPGVDLGLALGALGFLAGGGLAWWAQVNVFAVLGLDPLLGRVLTAITVGLGVEFLNDMMATVQGRRGLDVIAQVEGEVDGWPAGAREAADGPRVLRVRRIGPPVRGW